MVLIWGVGNFHFENFTPARQEGREKHSEDAISTVQDKGNAGSNGDRCTIEIYFQCGM